MNPSSGVYPTLYPSATFYPCRQHPGAEQLTVLVVDEGNARFDEPMCAECGELLMFRPLGYWNADHSRGLPG